MSARLKNPDAWAPVVDALTFKPPPFVALGPTRASQFDVCVWDGDGVCGWSECGWSECPWSECMWGEYEDEYEDEDERERTIRHWGGPAKWVGARGKPSGHTLRDPGLARRRAKTARRRGRSQPSGTPTRPSRASQRSRLLRFQEA